jgi:hypothetical protein
MSKKQTKFKINKNKIKNKTIKQNSLNKNGSIEKIMNGGVSLSGLRSLRSLFKKTKKKSSGEESSGEESSVKESSGEEPSGEEQIYYDLPLPKNSVANKLQKNNSSVNWEEIESLIINKRNSGYSSNRKSSGYSMNSGNNSSSNNSSSSNRMSSGNNNNSSVASSNNSSSSSSRRSSSNNNRSSSSIQTPAEYVELLSNAQINQNKKNKEGIYVSVDKNGKYYYNNKNSLYKTDREIQLQNLKNKIEGLKSKEKKIKNISKLEKEIKILSNYEKALEELEELESLEAIEQKKIAKKQPSLLGKISRAVSRKQTISKPPVNHVKQNLIEKIRVLEEQIRDLEQNINNN